jgi:hypothetical protein
MYDIVELRQSQAKTKTGLKQNTNFCFNTTTNHKFVGQFQGTNEVEIGPSEVHACVISDGVRGKHSGLY